MHLQIVMSEQKKKVIPLIIFLTYVVILSYFLQPQKRRRIEISGHVINQKRVVSKNISDFFFKLSFNDGICNNVTSITPSKNGTTKVN